MMVVTLSEENPYVAIAEDKGTYILQILDGEEIIDIPLKGDPKTVMNQIALYAGDY